MSLKRESSDDAVMQVLGSRLERYRLNANLTQEALAAEAGVSLRTVIRLEQGESVQLSTLIRVLRALDLLGNLDAVAPEPPISPIQQAKLKGKTRKRASGKTAPDKKPSTWTWKDEK